VRQSGEIQHVLRQGRILNIVLGWTHWTQGRREGGQGGHVPPEIPMLKKIQGFLVNTLFQWFLAYMSPSYKPPYSHQGSAAGPAGGLSPVPRFCPSETNFWLRR